MTRGAASTEHGPTCRLASPRTRATVVRAASGLCGGSHDEATVNLAVQRLEGDTMYRTSIVTLALFLFLSTSASTVFADAELAPGLTFTARSGHAGTGTTTIGAGSDVHAINLLTVGESFNVPCYLSVYKSDINVGGDSIFANWGTCTYTSHEEVGWLNNSGIHVHGIAVCTNSSHDRVKGIQLFGGQVLSDGTFWAMDLPISFSRPNCAVWHTAVFCPAGQVATKVRIDHDGGDTMTGLSLGCRVVIAQ